jgi:hypothetical protein
MAEMFAEKEPAGKHGDDRIDVGLPGNWAARSWLGWIVRISSAALPSWDNPPGPEESQNTVNVPRLPLITSQPPLRGTSPAHSGLYDLDGPLHRPT